MNNEYNVRVYVLRIYTNMYEYGVHCARVSFSSGVRSTRAVVMAHAMYTWCSTGSVRNAVRSAHALASDSSVQQSALRSRRAAPQCAHAQSRAPLEAHLARNALLASHR